VYGLMRANYVLTLTIVSSGSEWELRTQMIVVTFLAAIILHTLLLRDRALCPRLMQDVPKLIVH
jgi:hypothetical protein